MNPRTGTTQLIQSLGLSTPPIAVSFHDSIPENVAGIDGAVPAGCVFWQEAAKRTFVTSAVDHALCAIGVHTHNLEGAPETQPAELKQVLETMKGLDYVGDDEVADIAVHARKKKHVVYGPLDDHPTDPDLVMFFTNSRQGLVVSEAVTRVDAGVPPAMGRPACAAVPHVLNSQTAAMSLGCCGARTYLDSWSDDVALWALPAGQFERYVEEIVTLSKANDVLTLFHERRRADIAAGDRPTVKESVARIS
jgi:uncharacterized protein (DUF169 family)